MLLINWGSALLILAPGCIGLALAQSKLATKSEVHGDSKSPKARTYNLLPRYEIGDTDRFSFEIRLSRFQSGGVPDGENYAKAFFTQKVVDVRPNGAPVFHFVRDHTNFSISDATGKELIAQKLAFADGYSYDICFEDPFDFFPVNTKGWPNDIGGFMMFESVYVSHQFFHTVLTRQHGGLDRLIRPGMTVTMPDSGKNGVVGLPPETRVEVSRGPSTLQFLGIGEHGGQSAAVLWFDILYDVALPVMLGQKMDGRGREFLRGFIWVSPENGKLLGGKLMGSNLVALPGPDGSLRTNDVMVTGVLDRVAP